MEPFYNYSIPAVWVAWVLYWQLSSRNVKAAARRESIGSQASHLVPFIIAIVVLSWPDDRSQPFFHSIWPRSSLAFWIGLVLVLAGLGFAIWARRVLGRNWSAVVTLKQGHELIQTGPYRLVRHPIYTGILLACVGSAVPASEWRGYGACLLVLIAFTIKLRIEERWMTEYFGPLYAQYQKRTKMLVPFVW